MAKGYIASTGLEYEYTPELMKACNPLPGSTLWYTLDLVIDTLLMKSMRLASEAKLIRYCQLNRAILQPEILIHWMIDKSLCLPASDGTVHGLRAVAKPKYYKLCRTLGEPLCS